MVHVVHGTVAVTHVQLVRAAQCTAQPCAGRADRLGPVPGPRHDRGHRGGQRAPGAVGVTRVHPATLEQRGGFVLTGEQQGVRGRVPGQVATLHEDPGMERRRDRASLLERLVPGRGHGALGQHREFREVGGDQIRVGQQLPQGPFGVRTQQSPTGRGDHDGVDHDHGCAPHHEPVPDRVDDLHGAEHPHLDRIQGDVPGDRIQLVPQDLDGWGVYAHDAPGVLGDHCGDHTQPVPAQCGDGFQVRGVTRPARGIGSGNREDAGYGGRRRGVHDNPFASTS